MMTPFKILIVILVVDSPSSVGFSSLHVRKLYKIVAKLINKLNVRSLFKSILIYMAMNYNLFTIYFVVLETIVVLHILLTYGMW